MSELETTNAGGSAGGEDETATENRLKAIRKEANRLELDLAMKKLERLKREHEDFEKEEEARKAFSDRTIATTGLLSLATAGAAAGGGRPPFGHTSFGASPMTFPTGASSSSSSPAGARIGFDVLKSVEDEDGRLNIMYDKHKHLENVRDSYAYKRTSDEEKYSLTMSSDQTVVDAAKILQVVQSNSFKKEMTDQYFIAMKWSREGKPIPGTVSRWCPSVLFKKIAKMKAVTDMAVFTRALNWRWIFMAQSGLSLMHFDLDGGPLNLLHELTNLTKERLIRCLEGLELYLTCFLSLAWYNCTLELRTRLDIGSLNIVYMSYLRNRIENILCEFGEALRWPIPNPDKTIGGFLKIRSPEIVVQMFTKLLDGLIGGTSDEYAAYRNDEAAHLATLLKPEKGLLKLADQEEEEEGDEGGKHKKKRKRGKGVVTDKIVGGGDGGGVKIPAGSSPSPKTSGGGSTSVGGATSKPRVVSTVPNAFCMSHLGHLLGVYPAECSFASCYWPHLGPTEVTKEVALETLARAKKMPDHYRAALLKAIEATLV